jgi:hypothetical protein
LKSTHWEGEKNGVVLFKLGMFWAGLFSAPQSRTLDRLVENGTLHAIDHGCKAVIGKPGLC